LSSAEQLRIELARPEDAGAIVEIIRRGFRPEILDRFIYGCDGVERYVRDLIRAHPVTDTTFLVARDAGRVGGCIEMRGLPDRLFLNYVAVLPEVRAARIGSRLLATAIERCGRAGQHAMSLDVLEDNTVARGWYDRLGFTEVSETTWWTLPLLTGDEVSEEGVPGVPQQAVCHQAFGFSSLDLSIAGQVLRVGLLGDRWFRLTGPRHVLDERLHAALRGIDASREVLALLPAEETPESMPSVAERVTATLRLSVELEALTARLEELP